MRKSAKEDPEPSERNRPGIQVISRAANILRSLENEPNGLSLAEIAKKVGLARSTVQRIVGALDDEHFLIAATPKARVKLGPALLRLAASANVEIYEIVHPFMQQLSNTAQETVDLSVLKGQSAVFLDQIKGAHRLQAVSAVGENFPLYCTANGKALLATLDPEARSKLLVQPLKRMTPKTNTDIAILDKQIKEFEKTLIAYDHEEHTEGISALGTSFLDPLGRSFAISIPVPTARFERKKKELARLLKDTRTALINELGTQIPEK